MQGAFDFHMARVFGTPDTILSSQYNDIFRIYYIVSYIIHFQSPCISVIVFYHFLLNHFFKAKVGVTWLCQNRMRSHPCCLQVCYVVSNLHEVDVDFCRKTTLRFTDHRLYINFESNFSCTMC